MRINSDRVISYSAMLVGFGSLFIAELARDLGQHRAAAALTRAR
jgi:hypothetical protein